MRLDNTPKWHTNWRVINTPLIEISRLIIYNSTKLGVFVSEFCPVCALGYLLLACCWLGKHTNPGKITHLM